MDTFHAAVRRLIVVVFLVFIAGMVFASGIPEEDDGTQSAANQKCQTTLAGYLQQWPGGSASPSCALQLSPNGDGLYGFFVHYFVSGGVDKQFFFAFDGAAVDNPCTSLVGSSDDIVYNPGQGTPAGGVTYVTDSVTGANVGCPFTLSWSAPTAVEDAYGHLHIHYTQTYTGNVATSGSHGATGTSQYDDQSGNVLVPQPTATQGPSPQLCGGGSCYDPNANQFCASSGGSQFCVSGSTASSSQGGCSSSGGGTLCAGSPTAPSPVGTSGSQVTNPTTQIQSSDQYTQANAATGALSTVTVNSYQAPGGSVSSGASSSSTKAANSGSASTQPASSSSSGNNDSFGGGGDCNTPPVCSGDAVMCGVAREAWQTSCNVSVQTTALAGSNPSQQPPTFASDQTKYSQSDVWQQPSSGNTAGDAANQGSYDQTGFGYSTTCPMTDLTVSIGTVGSVVIPFSDGCVIGPWIYWLVIGFSLYRAARITAGSAI